MRGGIILVILASGCAAQRPVVPQFPNTYADQSDFSDLRLRLHRFNVSGAPKAEGLAQPELRRRFLEYVRAQTNFEELVDAQWVWSATPYRASRGTLTLDVSMVVSHSTHRTYVLDVLTAPFGSALAPWWGKAKVVLTAHAVGPTGRTVWEGRATGEDKYLIMFWPWFRNGPLEDAYGRAASRAFERVIGQLSAQNRQIVAQVRGRGQPWDLVAR